VGESIEAGPNLGQPGAQFDTIFAKRPQMSANERMTTNPMTTAKCKRSLEARVGIEPTHKGFADLSLTTWVPRPMT
jgi:hypothetical protein